MNSPLVSIIVPTFNRGYLLNETLDSIINQTYKNWECIFVDDGSRDNTKEIIISYSNSDSRIKYYKRPLEKCKGANACRNYGFSLSKGVYVNWFDDDDIMHCDKLKIQVEALKNNEFNFSVCQAIVFENSIDDIKGLRHNEIYSSNSLNDYLSRKIIWMTPSALWSKEFLLQFNILFDEELQAAQEWEFHCRMLYHSPNYHFTNKPLVYLRHHNESISYNSQNKKREFHYYKAREKVSKFLNSKKINSTFLSNYFVSKYKFHLKERFFKRAFIILKNNIILDKNLNRNYRFKLLSAFWAYLIFNRGEFLFKKNTN